MSLWELSKIQEKVAFFESLEVKSRAEAFVNLKCDLATRYINRVGATEESRIIILRKTIERILQPFDKMNPSRLFKMILDYFDQVVKVICNMEQSTAEQRLSEKDLINIFNEFYLRWAVELRVTDIYSCGLSLQESGKITYELLYAIYCSFWGDLMLVDEYSFSAALCLEKAQAIFKNKTLLKNKDAEPLKEQLLIRSSIKNSYKGGAKLLDRSKWEYLFDNEKNNGLDRVRRANIRNKASYSMLALHEWLLQEGYFQQKELNRISDIGNKFTEFGRDIVNLADIDC